MVNFSDGFLLSDRMNRMDRIGSEMQAADGNSLFGELPSGRLSILFILFILSKIIRSVTSRPRTCFKMGGADDSPTEMTEAATAKRASGEAVDATAIPSGESPDGTGW
jgi:hypothetical protein